MEIILVVLLMVLALCFWELRRNTQVLKFRLRLLDEEFVSGKGRRYGGFKRFDSLPSYNRMLLEFWKPLSSYEKPLSDYYND